MAKIFLGVGHGGTDSGATANGFKEKDLNLAIALACRDELLKNNCIVGMSRTTDENDSISEEVRECNAFGPDLAVDIHNNAGGGNGAEVFYTYKGGKGKELAENILAEIVKLGQNSRGIKTRKNSSGNDYYAFIRSNNAPAAIVECAFVDNAEDMKIIDTEAERKAMGQAIAKGILKTLGVDTSQTAEKAPTTTTTAEYYPKYAGNSNSVVDALKSLKIDATLANRKKIAAVNGIANYTGKAAQNTQMLSLLKAGKLIKQYVTVKPAETQKEPVLTAPTVKYYKKYSGTSKSVVDALKSLKIDASFSNRRKIAAANNIKLYIGTAAQNTKILNSLKQGKLIQP